MSPRRRDPPGSVQRRWRGWATSAAHDDVAGRRRAGLALALVVAAVLPAAACTDRYEPLDVGQCLPPGAPVIGRRAQAPDVVPCSQPHQYEVFARQDLEPPGPRWPGADLVELNAKRLCGIAIKGATGRQIRDLPDGVTVVQVRPTESSWRDGDREVECLFRWDEPTTRTLVRGDG